MGNELVVQGNSWLVMKEQATMLVKSGFLPSAVNTPEKAIAIILKGKELGLPMMQSLSSIHVIQGKPTISAELMAALVFQKMPSAILNCVESTDKVATYEAQRPNGKLTKMSFTWEDAVKAGVTGKDNWKNYTAAMLRARACSAICRVVFPDAIMGVYTPDELGAITDEEGAPIDVTPEPVAPESQEVVATDKDKLLGEMLDYCSDASGDVDFDLWKTVMDGLQKKKDGTSIVLEDLMKLDPIKNATFFKKLYKAWSERG